MVQHFRSHAQDLAAIEVEGIVALHLLSYGALMSAQSNHKNSKDQIRLNINDQEMCKVKILYFS